MLKARKFNVYLTLIYINNSRYIAIGEANGKSSTFTIKKKTIGYTQIVWLPVTKQ